MSRHGERGAVLAEFAMVSVFVMTILLGIVEFGRALYTYHLVSNAARLGSRFAIVRGSDCSKTRAGCTAATSSDVQTYVRGVSPGVDPTKLAVTASWSTAPTCVGSPFQSAGCLVTVQATYTFNFLVPLIPVSSIPMNAKSIMVMSQ